MASAVILCAGCGKRAVHRPADPSPPALTVTVFNDGFHSGVIVPYAGMPITLDRQRPEAANPLPYVEIGFGEAKWVQNLDRSFLHLLRLGIWPSHGMLMMVNHDERRRTDPKSRRTRYWDIQLTEGGKRAFYAEIAGWLDQRQLYMRSADDPLFLYASTRDYTVFRNCHDFTIEVLAAARFPVARGCVNTSGSLDRNIAVGIKRLREEGLESVGP